MNDGHRREGQNSGYGKERTNLHFHSTPLQSERIHNSLPKEGRGQDFGFIAFNTKAKKVVTWSKSEVQTQYRYFAEIHLLRPVSNASTAITGGTL